MRNVIGSIPNSKMSEEHFLLLITNIYFGLQAQSPVNESLS